jgi:hypothetical protein
MECLKREPEASEKLVKSEINDGDEDGALEGVDQTFEGSSERN